MILSYVFLGRASHHQKLARQGTNWNKTAALLKREICRELLPAVVFCFSKKRVDALADMLPHLDFTSAKEKHNIHIFFEEAIFRLKGTDRQLPQILRVREMLKRGLGVHHAGDFEPELPRVMQHHKSTNNDNHSLLVI